MRRQCRLAEAVVEMAPHPNVVLRGGIGVDGRPGIPVAVHRGDWPKVKPAFLRPAHRPVFKQLCPPIEQLVVLALVELAFKRSINRFRIESDERFPGQQRDLSPFLDGRHRLQGGHLCRLGCDVTPGEHRRYCGSHR